MTLPDYETLALSRVDDHILVVTLNRPDVLNAINTQMGIDTLDLWTRLTASAQGLRCVVLTGAGDRAFCAGGDLKQRAEHAVLEHTADPVALGAGQLGLDRLAGRGLGDLQGGAECHRRVLSTSGGPAARSGPRTG